MEHHLKSITIGIAQNILVKLHGLLLVTSKEVNLDTLNTNALKPLHFLLASDRGVHAIAWGLGSIVPETITVIPQ